MKLCLEYKLFLIAVITIKNALFWEVRYGNGLIFLSYNLQQCIPLPTGRQM